MKNCKRIALIGLDGSGKSTNISAMKADKLFEEYHFLWVRWEPKLLRPLYWILEKKVSAKSTSFERKELSQQYNAKSGIKDKIFKNPIIRTVWLTMALIDYIIQFYIKVIKSLIKRENIIFDRFYLDLFVDQGINFGYSPEKIDRIIKKYEKLFPKTERYIYIRVSPHICYERKDDIPSMEYLMKRYDIYEKLSQNPDWYVVNGEETFEKVYASVKEAILND